MALPSSSFVHLKVAIIASSHCSSLGFPTIALYRSCIILAAAGTKINKFAMPGAP